MTERTLTVAEAAQATGSSEKALRRRIERQVLRSLIGPDGRRRIPASALGLNGAGEAGKGAAPGHGAPRRAVNGSNGSADLIDRVERLSRELGAYRQLEIVAGQDRDELIKARARITELEAQLAERGRWRRLKRSR